MNVFERDKIRNKLLVEIYQHTDGDIRLPINLGELGRKLQLDENEVEKAYYYLVEEDFIGPHGTGYIITLSHSGLKMVESILRKIDFDDDREFNSTEIFQLKLILNEIKDEIKHLHLGQEVIFNEIDAAFEESKVKTKQNWKEFFSGQLRDWAAQQIIDNSAQLIIQSLLIGLKVSSV